jgi:hypothetical protein
MLDAGCRIKKDDGENVAKVALARVVVVRYGCVVRDTVTLQYFHRNHGCNNDVKHTPISPKMNRIATRDLMADY